MTKEIELTQGYKAIVDDEDFEYLSQFKWAYNNGYARHGSRNNVIYMHRVILERKLDRPLVGRERPDHEDHTPTNNTRDNLRLATPSQNTANISKFPDKSSRFKGVSWHKKAQKWVACIRVNGYLLYLGTFPSDEDAARVYDQTALLWFGKFANLNFPNEWLELTNRL